MFTGLIESTGEVAEIKRRGDGARICVMGKAWEERPVLGESVAVSGACLTLCEADGGRYWFDALSETLKVTTLGSARPGTRVNLERALRVGDRIGGHFVTGHVDGMGRVVAVERVGADWSLTVGCESGLLRGMVRKGSVACDGVSLTIVEVKADCFTVHIIPTTWTNTTLGFLKAGMAVNLETDMLGKYVASHVAGLGSRGGVTLEQVMNAGFGG